MRWLLSVAVFIAFFISNSVSGAMTRRADVEGDKGATAQHQATGATTAASQSRSVQHERMDFFRGLWEVEPGGMAGGRPMPAGRRETCDWLPGAKRHMMCRTERQRPDGTKAESIYLLSYRTEDDTYLAYFAFPDGANLLYHGKPEGHQWIMSMQMAPGLQPSRRFRTIITPTENGMRFVEESSRDGGPWIVTEDYRYRRVK